MIMKAKIIRDFVKTYLDQDPWLKDFSKRIHKKRGCQACMKLVHKLEFLRHVEEDGKTKDLLQKYFEARRKPSDKFLFLWVPNANGGGKLKTILEAQGG